MIGLSGCKQASQLLHELLEPVDNDECHGICGMNSSVDSLNNENGADSANNVTGVGN